MRVLHIINSLDASAGGPPAVVTRLAAAQAKLGAHVTILHGPSQGKPAVLHADVHEITLDCPVSGLDALLQREPEQLINAISDSDVVHLHGLWEPLLPVAAVAASKRNKPVVLLPHGMLDPWALSQKPLKKKIALGLLYNRVICAAYVMHASNDHEAESLRVRYPGTTVKLVPSAVDLDELRPIPTRDAFHSAHPELDEKPYILFLSRLHPVKGLDILLEAFETVVKDHPDLQFVIAGPDHGAEQSVRKRAEAPGLKSRVHVVGPLWGKDKAAAYAGAEVFVLASDHESFGLVIAEAMACSRPVVITDTCNFPDVAAHDTGRITERAHAPFAHALREVLADPAAADAMGQRGKELVETRFTWEISAAALLEVYHDLAGRDDVFH